MDFQKANVNELSRRLKRIRLFAYPALIFFLAALICWPKVQSFKFLFAVEQASLSLRFLVRGVEERANDETRIVLVTVDDRSLFPQLSEADIAVNPEAKLLEEPWPWNRAIHGVVAQRLIDAGAKVVAFDFVFPSPSEGDFDLLDVIEANPGRVVLGYDYSVSENELGETLVEERLPYDDLLPLDESGLLGFVNIQRDPDGVLRRAKLTTNIYSEKQAFIANDEARARIQALAERSENYLSLGAQAAALSSDGAFERIERLPDYPIINYGGLDYFESVSYVDILLKDRFLAHESLFEDSIVIVGSFSDFFKDVLQTPFGDMYGVETHGHVARSLLNDSFYRNVSSTWQLVLVSCLALLISVGILYLRAASSKGIFLLLVFIGNSLLSQWLFSRYGLVLPVMPVVWIVGVGGGLLLLCDYVIEQYERKRMRSYLDRYVSPEIAQLIVEEPARLESVLRGANRSIVSMFADIRGFTALSEGADPEVLVQQLNEYFEGLVEVILRRKGSLNKYIGDAVLAVWGGIYSDGDEQDSQLAIAAALAMVEELERLNIQWQGTGRPRLGVGIGISRGNGFVGNLGHSQRKEFAVMGDVVNLASRIEGLTRVYGCSILVSEEMRICPPEGVVFQEIDLVQVKGRSAPVRIYQPVRASDGEAWLVAWHSALKLYREDQFAEAMAAFADFQQDQPQQAALAECFMLRCEQFLAHPPPADWAGVYVATRK